MENIGLLESDLAVAMTERLVDLKKGCVDCDNNIYNIQDNIFKAKFERKIYRRPIVPPTPVITMWLDTNIWNDSLIWID